jgi:hypothetical protein
MSQVLPAPIAQQLHPVAAVSNKRIKLNIIIKMHPKTGKATTCLKLFIGFK